MMIVIDDGLVYSDNFLELLMKTMVMTVMTVMIMTTKTLLMEVTMITATILIVETHR